MKDTKEINALFTLIDDPDEEVFGAVSSRIINYGSGLIPNLENLWENTINDEVQERIELLIHRLHFYDLKEEFDTWFNNPIHDLLKGSLLVSKFNYPDLSEASVLKDIEKLRRNIWLELNNYLTPLEQINVLTSILHNYFNLKGTEVNYSQPEDFLISKQLESKKGNSIANGIIYLILAELLEIPIKAIKIPRQFVLAYIKQDYDIYRLEGAPNTTIEFFIDPLSGQVFTQKDLDVYFKKIDVPISESYFKPLSNLRVIQLLLEEFSKCFIDPKTNYKKQELIELSNLLDK